MNPGEFTEQVLILKVGCFREADCWVRFFTPSHGLMTAFAFGGKRSRKRFLGCLDAFNQVLFRIKASRGGRYLCLEEGSLLRSFPRLRTDQARIGMAVNCVKFLEMTHEGLQDSRPTYQLLLDSLDFLNDQEIVNPIFPILFRAKVAFDQGYHPQLDSCPDCGRMIRSMDDPVFSVDGGRVYCKKCRLSQGNDFPVHPKALSFLRSVIADGPFVRDQDLPGDARRDFYVLVDAYIQYHLGLLWEGNRFRRI